METHVKSHQTSKGHRSLKTLGLFNAFELLKSYKITLLKIQQCEKIVVAEGFTSCSYAAQYDIQL